MDLLTPQEQIEALLMQYRIDPLSVHGRGMCGAKNTRGYWCSRGKDHPGPHIALYGTRSMCTGGDNPWI